jgi:hypothetical protein
VIIGRLRGTFYAFPHINGAKIRIVTFPISEYYSYNSIVNVHWSEQKQKKISFLQLNIAKLVHRGLTLSTHNVT